MLQFSSVLALALLGCSAAAGELDGSDKSSLEGEWDGLEHDTPSWSDAELTRTPAGAALGEPACEHPLTLDRAGHREPTGAVAMIANDSRETATVKLTRRGALVDVTVIAAGAAGAIGLPGLVAETTDDADPESTDRYQVSSDQPVRVYRLSNAGLEEKPMQQQAFVKLGVTLLPLMLVQPASSGCAAPLEPTPVDEAAPDEGTGGEPDLGQGGAGTASTGATSASSTAATGGTGANGTGGSGGNAPVPSCDSPDPNQCVTCQQCAATTQCKPEYDACTTTPDCTNLSNCLTACNAEPTCEDTCLTQHPSGAPLLEAAANCLYCSACPASCNLCN
jgi:hypothetical protein